MSADGLQADGIARWRQPDVADVLLGVLCISLVGVMVAPMPTWALDLLISLDISLGALLLLLAVSVADVRRVASFPTFLLLATLFRLALNVASTRLILLHGDAGRVIHGFGSVVVGGNFVVGAVVFAVLTLVQFLVIARGSGRIAEVAARFTLDALPGRQLAIDAERRAGAIGAEEARRRRTLLQRESQLYGAMDGAMKFVKGDAIAGLVIVAVNVVGGLIVGTTQRGLSAGEALHAYGLLTVGDGLAAQIPALFVSVAAGVVVTRVRGEDEHAPLALPRALALVAGLGVLLALVPGLPAWPFVAVAALSGGVALVASRRAVADEAPARLVLRAEADAASLLAEARATLAELGVPVPRIGVERRPGPPAWTLAGLPLDGTLRRHAHELLGIQEVHELCAELERAQPALVREVVPRLTLPVLADVLRRLVEEGVSIRDLRGILGALAGAESRDASTLTEHVRTALRRQISFAHTRGGASLAAWIVEPMIEDALRDAARPGGLALEPELARELRAAFACAGAAPVIVTAPDVRRPMKQLLEQQAPDATVLSFAELAPGVTLEPLGCIRP